MTILAGALPLKSWVPRIQKLTRTCDLQELREQQRQPSYLKDGQFYGRDVQSRRRDPADCRRLYHSRGEWQPVLHTGENERSAK